MRVAAEGKAVGNVLDWALRDEWAEEWSCVFAEHLAPVCEDLDLAPEALESALGSDGFGIAFACAMEDFLSRSVGEDGRNIVDDYLKRRGWRESGAAKTYLRALRASVMSLYEVVDLAPGKHLVLRDLIRGGEPVRVDERLGSQTAARWDRMAVRVLSVAGKRCLSGGALLLPHDTVPALLDAIDRAAKRERAAAKRRAKRTGGAADVSLETLKVEMLPRLAPIFTRTWLVSNLGRLSQPPPRFVNFDGHDIVFAEIRYPLLPDAALEIERRLDAAPLIERDGDDVREWTWLRGGEPPGVAPTEGARRAFASDFGSDDGRWTFARIVLEAETLLLTCNSRERADLATTKLAGLLDGLIGQPLTSMQTAEQAMAESDAKRSGEKAAPETVPPEIAGPLLRQVLDDHYRGCLKEPIGMLDGKTPRQAVRSKKGRQQVVAWLKHLENAAARRAQLDPAAAYDFSWMWEELGIADLRE